MKTINATLSSQSLEQMINELRAEETGLTDKCRRLCSRLAEIGVSVVRTVYSVADYAGTNDVVVSFEVAQEGATIIANGQSVAFLEFGTGVSYPLGEYAAQAGAPPHGSYGKGKGNQKIWGYYGEQGTLGIPVKGRDDLYLTHGNPPANAFPQAVATIKESFIRIAKEVFEA